MNVSVNPLKQIICNISRHMIISGNNLWQEWRCSEDSNDVTKIYYNLSDGLNSTDSIKTVEPNLEKS